MVGTIDSVQFGRSVVSNSLWPHEPHHTRPPCPSPTPRVHPNPCPLSRWCHPTISSSIIPFSSCPQFFPTSGSFPMSQLFAWERGKGPEGGGRQLTVWRLETWRRWEEVCISPPFHFYSWWQRTAEGQDLPRARDCAKSFVWILFFDPHNISLRRHFYSP